MFLYHFIIYWHLLVPFSYKTLRCNMPPRSNARTPNARQPNAPSRKQKRALNAKWSDDEITSMVLQLLQAKQDGNTSDNGFKSTVWTAIASSFADPRKNERRVGRDKVRSDEERLWLDKVATFRGLRIRLGRRKKPRYGWGFSLGRARKGMTFIIFLDL